MEAKTTRRRGSTTFRRDAAQVEHAPLTQKIKRSISLTADTSRRLDVYAAMFGKNCSQVVEELISGPIRRFTIQDRGEKGDPSTGRGGEILPMAVDYSAAE